ncbi:MAG: methyltransferase domain-containing protein, partial [Olleya sp.]
MSTQPNPFLEVKDHSVSGETFQLKENKTFGYLETYPQPSSEKLPDYYKSEDYISHTDSKRSLFEKAYHTIRSISLKRKLKLINSFNSEEKKILDIGCGTGDFLKTAQNNNWTIVGIEPNKEARTIANSKTNNLAFDNSKLKDLPKHSFDV